MPRHRQASNDNSPEEGAQQAPGAKQAKPRQTYRVVVTMADPLPILDSEVALFEAYLSDVISTIIANDN